MCSYMNPLEKQCVAKDLDFCIQKGIIHYFDNEKKALSFLKKSSWPNFQKFVFKHNKGYIIGQFKIKRNKTLFISPILIDNKEYPLELLVDTFREVRSNHGR